MGDIFVAGGAWGKVRTLIDDTGKRVTEAGPSMPVQVGGFDGSPDAGDMFTVVDREDTARDLAEARRKIAREATAATLKVTNKQRFTFVSSNKKQDTLVATFFSFLFF